ncbi:hypothetical protein QFZ41_002224 [Luteibacter sp. W1I16]|uniref:hypothetical protein n=1 Tax=Luteibacter sp. W1I16 TaxID=3373922 RepID=UPI003D1FD2AC
MTCLRSGPSGMRLPGAIVAAWMLLPGLAMAREAGCEVTSDTATIDYGRLSRATTVPTGNGELVLPSRTARLEVRCSQPEDMTMFFRAVPLNAQAFRFADQGRFSLRLRDGLLDGEPVNLAQLDRPGAPPLRTGASLPWLPGQGIAPLKAGFIATGKVFTAYVDIDARLDAAALNVGDATRWQSGGRIEASGASREFSVQAEAIAGSCSVDVIRHIAFGTLHSTDLDIHGASTAIHAAQRGELQVRCDAPIPIALRVQRDERAGTVAAPVGLGVSYPDDQLFGLGTTRAGANIGAYVLRWAATAMSAQGELLATRSVDHGHSWAPTAGSAVASHAPSERMGYASSSHVAAGPAAVAMLDVMLDAEIYIAPIHLLPRSEEIGADGLVSFEIIY